MPYGRMPIKGGAIQTPKHFQRHAGGYETGWETGRRDKQEVTTIKPFTRPLDSSMLLMLHIRYKVHSV